MDPLAQIRNRRLEFGFTAPVINGSQIGEEKDLKRYLNLPRPEARREQIAVTSLERGAVVKPGWKSRLPPPVPDNLLSYQIYLPRFQRWKASLGKAEINRIFEMLKLEPRFVEVTGNAELEMVPYPSIGGFYRHIFEHEASHAEDHIEVLGRNLEDWDRNVTRAVNLGWGFDSFSEAGTVHQLWSAVGTKPDVLLDRIWTQLDEAGHEFHKSIEGRPPRFLRGTIDEDGARATLVVAAPEPRGG